MHSIFTRCGGQDEQGRINSQGLYLLTTMKCACLILQILMYISLTILLLLQQNLTVVFYSQRTSIQFHYPHLQYFISENRCPVPLSSPLVFRLREPVSSSTILTFGISPQRTCVQFYYFLINGLECMVECSPVQCRSCLLSE